MLIAILRNKSKFNVIRVLSSTTLHYTVRQRPSIITIFLIKQGCQGLDTLLVACAVYKCSVINNGLRGPWQ